MNDWPQTPPPRSVVMRAAEAILMRRARAAEIEDVGCELKAVI